MTSLENVRTPPELPHAELPHAELPHDSGLTWRALTESDLGPWMDLVSRIQDHDRVRERTTIEDLQHLVQQSWVDLGADSIVGIDGAGVFQAWARNGFRPGSFTTITVHLLGGVDPAWRGRGIGRQVLAWQQARAVRNVADLRAAAPDAAELPALIGCFAEEQVVGRTRLLGAAGHVAVRWFYEMRKSLPEGVGDASPERALPDGFSLDVFSAAVSEQVRIAHNEAFRGHWGSAAMNREAWRTGLIDHPAFRPDLSFVVTDRSGPQSEVVGYALNTEFEDDWAAQGFTEGYTEGLGVRPAWRGKGLAAQLLDASARAFAERGHPYATLTVDADNPGALRLYEALGYVQSHTTVYHAQEA